MNEAATRAELIDPALKATGRRVAGTSRVRREVITLGRRQGAGKPSSHRGPNISPSSDSHGHAIIGHPPRNVTRLIEYVGDHRRRPGLPREPVAMQLDPAKSVSGKFRIGPRVGQPGTRFRRDPSQRRIVRFNQPPSGLWRGGAG